MKMFLEGKWADRDERIDVTNPFDNSVIDTVPRANAGDVDRALTTLIAGAAAMRKLSAYERFQILRKTAERMLERTEDLATTISKEEGKILGVQCSECNRTLIPPRAFCELCFRPINRWVELRDTGVINTFSVSFVNWDATRREIPEVPAVIEIDAASPGMGILHLLGEVGDDLDSVLAKVSIGKKVQAVWKPSEEREGSITDIRYFKLID